MKVSHKPASTLAKATQAKDPLAKRAMRGKIAANPLAKPESSQVKLSNQAQQIRKATELAKDPSVNEKKIAQLQKMIDSGQYQVDAAKVADRLVDEHLKMPT